MEKKNTNHLSVILTSKLKQTWHPASSNTWVIAYNWPRGRCDPMPYNIATNEVPRGWAVTPFFDVSPSEVAITYPDEAKREGQYTVFVMGAQEDELGNGFFCLPALSTASSMQKTSGTEVIVELPVGMTTEITATHPEIWFSLCEYPDCIAPFGVRVSVLACGTGGDHTNGQQFVLLVENINYRDENGLSSPPDVTIRWTRCGVLQ